MIGVTGATGGVGSRTVRHLLSHAQAPPVVALARRPEAVPRAARRTARRADYDDPVSLRRAFEGLGVLVFVSSDGTAEAMAGHHRNVVAAAAEAGVGRLVYTSILDIEADSRFYYSPGHRRTEALLAASGIDHCLARTSVFADFFAETWLSAAVASGELALPLGGARISLVTREDVARGLAAAAVRGSRGVLELTGPRALTGEEICRIAATAAARPVRFVDLEPADYRARLRAAGEPRWLIEAYASMFRSCAEGRFAAVAPDLSALTGREPEGLDRFLARRSASGRCR